MQPPAIPLSGRYGFKRALQTGAKAPTWIATDEQTGGEVVVAVLAPARLAPLRQAVGLRHPHLASIIEVVENPDPAAVVGAREVPAVVVAEYIPGESLHQALKRGPLDPATAIQVVTTLTDACTVLHKAGAAHGAISPRAVVFDPESDRAGPVLSQLIYPSSGAYCAPERLQGRGPSSQDDTWALTALLFTSLTCSPPFRGDTKDELLLAIAGGRQQRLEELGINDFLLTDIFDRGLIADTTRRRHDIHELAKVLNDWTPPGDWDDDEATLIASKRDLAALGMDGPKPEPVPSVPPVPMSHEDVGLPTFSDMPGPAFEEDDATTVMERPSEALAFVNEPLQHTQPLAAEVPPTPPPAAGSPPVPLPAAGQPPPVYEPINPTQPVAQPAQPDFAAPTVPNQAAPAAPTLPYQDPPAPPAESAPGSIPYAADPAAPFDEEPPPIPSAAAPDLPAASAAPAEAAFPPAVSAYPPAISAPSLAPSIAPQVDLSDVELRPAGRRPLIVIFVILVLAAIGIGVALYFNNRASRAGTLTTSVTAYCADVAS